MRFWGLAFVVACGGGSSPVDPDSPLPVEDAAIPRTFHFLHTRFASSPEIGFGSLTGDHLAIRALDGGVGAVGFTVLSPDATRIAFLDFDSQNRHELIVRSLVDGTEVPLSFTSPRAQATWSPDGTRIAFDSLDQLVLSDSNASFPMPVTPLDAGAECAGPQWSPDGTEIAFSTGAGLAAYVIADDSVRTILADADDTGICTPRWSPDGSALAFTRFPVGAPGDPGDIARVAATGGAVLSLAPLESGGQIQWSPDGTKLAYVDFDEKISRGVLRVVDATQAGTAPLALDELGAGIAFGNPQWSPDGTTLLYVRFDAGDVQITTIPATGGTRTPTGLSGAGGGGTFLLWLPAPIQR